MLSRPNEPTSSATTRAAFAIAALALATVGWAGDHLVDEDHLDVPDLSWSAAPFADAPIDGDARAPAELVPAPVLVARQAPVETTTDAVAALLDDPSPEATNDSGPAAPKAAAVPEGAAEPQTTTPVDVPLAHNLGIQPMLVLPTKVARADWLAGRRDGGRQLHARVSTSTAFDHDELEAFAMLAFAARVDKAGFDCAVGVQILTPKSMAGSLVDVWGMGVHDDWPSSARCVPATRTR